MGGVTIIRHRLCSEHVRFSHQHYSITLCALPFVVVVVVAIIFGVPFKYCLYAGRFLH